MPLSTLRLSQESSTNGNESGANAAESHLFAEVCRNEKHAPSSEEEIAAALCILGI
jgi:hypothetical protein